MPELPDLEVFSKNLEKKFAGKKLKQVKVLNKKKLKVTAAKLKKSLEGSALKKVYREGKEIHFAFSNGNVLGWHLMLRGGMSVFEKKNDAKYTIMELLFSNDAGLALTDYQSSATPTLNPEEKDAPDALSKEINFSFLKELLSRKKTIIKNLLLDQKSIRGIGNAYADEILWKAGISPFSIANKIPDDKIRALIKAIPFVLQNAIKQIRKKNPEIISGEVRDFLKIHNSKMKKSPTGGKIVNKMINGRITYYTSEQKLFK
jgi:formamidopyrimidine-DNA glycosylase